MATETRTITVCDKCCELLEHNTSGDGELIEIRIEPCPECSQLGLKFSEAQLKLILRMIKHVKPKAIKSTVFSLADHDDLIGIENEIRELKALLA